MPLLENFQKQGNYLFKHRGAVPVVIIVPGLLIAYFTRAELQSIFQTQWHKLYELFCFLICLVGFGIRAFTVGHTPDGTSGRNTEKQVADYLNTKGMYSIVRHPLYLANYLMWLGICMRVYNIWFTIIASLFFWIYYERIMFAEEQFLRDKYGAGYIAWASKTPTFLPNFYLWQPWPSAINYKKILRQERTGLLVMFFMFFIIELVSEWETKSAFTNEWWWTIGIITGIVAFVILKVLEKTTSVLND